MNEWSLAIGIYNITVIDIIIIVLLIIGAVLGAVKGFAREASTRFGFIVAVFVAFLFTELGSTLIINTFNLPLLWSSFIAFLLIFIVAYTIMLTIGTLLEKTLETIKLGWLDSLLGLVLGFVEMFLAVTFIIYILDMQNVIDVYQYLSKSEIFTRIIEPNVPKGIEFLKGVIKDV
ncbi:MAG: CvpA family protein [Spirochaetia bacterium]|nr:CvpA family protein [Spirochaetia bacterium]